MDRQSYYYNLIIVTPQSHLTHPRGLHFVLGESGVRSVGVVGRVGHGEGAREAVRELVQLLALARAPALGVLGRGRAAHHGVAGGVAGQPGRRPAVQILSVSCVVLMAAQAAGRNQIRSIRRDCSGADLAVARGGDIWTPGRRLSSNSGGLALLFIIESSVIV